MANPGLGLWIPEWICVHESEPGLYTVREVLFLPLLMPGGGLSRSLEWKSRNKKKEDWRFCWCLYTKVLCQAFTWVFLCWQMSVFWSMFCMVNSLYKRMLYVNLCIRTTVCYNSLLSFFHSYLHFVTFVLSVPGADLQIWSSLNAASLFHCKYDNFLCSVHTFSCRSWRLHHILGGSERGFEHILGCTCASVACAWV